MKTPDRPESAYRRALAKKREQEFSINSKPRENRNQNAVTTTTRKET